MIAKSLTGVSGNFPVCGVFTKPDISSSFNRSISLLINNCLCESINGITSRIMENNFTDHSYLELGMLAQQSCKTLDGSTFTASRVVSKLHINLMEFSFLLIAERVLICRSVNITKMAAGISNEHFFFCFPCEFHKCLEGGKVARTLRTLIQEALQSFTFIFHLSVRPAWSCVSNKVYGDIWRFVIMQGLQNLHCRLLSQDPRTTFNFGPFGFPPPPSPFSPLKRRSPLYHGKDNGSFV